MATTNQPSYIWSKFFKPKTEGAQRSQKNLEGEIVKNPLFKNLILHFMILAFIHPDMMYCIVNSSNHDSDQYWGAQEGSKFSCRVMIKIFFFLFSKNYNFTIWQISCKDADKKYTCILKIVHFMTITEA